MIEERSLKTNMKLKNACKYVLDILFILAVLTHTLQSVSGKPCDAVHLVESSFQKTNPSGCSVFTVSKGNQVFFGGNDDYITSDNHYWIDPGDADGYGVIWIGQPDNVQQGVNECGLAYDANGLPRVDVNPHPERIPVHGDYTSYPIQILHACATVEEVITWISAHQWHSYMHDQMHFADANGDAVIISAASGGELAFTRKPPGDGFLVSTNFNVASPSNGYGYPCWRYDRAREMLGQLVSRDRALTFHDAADVLYAISQQGGTSWTVSSLLADLTSGVIYLYYFYQFDRPVVLNVLEELDHPRAAGPLSQLFPDEVRQEAASRYEQMNSRALLCRWVSTVWLVLVLISLVILVALPPHGKRDLRLWIPAVILSGPLALTARLVAGPTHKPPGWKAVLTETSGDMAPTIIAFVVFLMVLLLVPAVQANPLLQLVFMLFLPPLAGLLVFHGPFLSRVANMSRGRFLFHRLPHVIVVSNIGMGGITIIGMYLINLSLQFCPLMPFRVWTIIPFWIIGALGAVIGGLLIAIYDRWTVKRGFHAWSALATGEGEARTHSWRRLWWWILLSYAILFAGIASGVALEKALG